MHFKVYEPLERRAQTLRARTEENKRKIKTVFDQIKDTQHFNLKTIIDLAGVPEKCFFKDSYYQLKKEITSHANYRKSL